jgi:hypothetical protein
MEANVSWFVSRLNPSAEYRVVAITGAWPLCKAWCLQCIVGWHCTYFHVANADKMS